MKKFLVLVVVLICAFGVSVSGQSSSLESRLSGIESKNTKPGALERLRGYEEGVQQRVLSYLDGMYNFVSGDTMEDKLGVVLDSYESYMNFWSNILWYLLFLVLGGVVIYPYMFEVKLFGKSFDFSFGENVFMVVGLIFVGCVSFSGGLVLSIFGVVNFISWQFY